MLKSPISRFPFIPFVFVVVLSLVLASCGAQGTPVQPGNQGQQGPGSGPQKGGTWIVALFNEPDALIPNSSVQTFSSLVAQTLYAPLFYGDSNGKLNPGIASEIPTSANGGASADLKTWTFKLRPGLKWSDGQPLTAEDIDFTWRLWQNPKFAAAETVAFRLIQDAKVADDKLSITFTLSQGFAPFVAAWGDARRSPLPKHHYEKMDPAEIKKTEGLNPQVVSGPFKMKESKVGVNYTVERNPNYYRASEGLPYLDSIIFRPIPNQDTLLKDLQAGTVHSAWFLDVTKMDTYKELQDYEIVQSPSASYEGLHFNFKNELLQDLTVRKAMSLAIDRESLVKIARSGQAESLCIDHTPVYNPGYQANAVCPKFDLDAANKLLDDAGWIKGSDGVRSKDGKRLEFNYSTTANNRWREKDQLINQENFKKIGINLLVRNYPANTFFGSFLIEGDPTKYQIAEWGSSYVFDPDNAASFSCSQIPPKGKGNLNHYCNEQLEPLFQQGVLTDNPEKRQQVYDQIHQIMLDEVAVIPMFALTDVSIHKKGTNNYKPGPFGASETSEVWSWWCTGGTCP